MGQEVMSPRYCTSGTNNDVQLGAGANPMADVCSVSVANCGSLGGQ